MVKGLLLAAAGTGALYLTRDGAAESLSRWIARLPLHPARHWVDEPLGAALAVDPRTLREIGLATFVYAAVFIVEGAGLLLRRHWAEYLAVIATASFLPLEIYELLERVEAIRALVVLANLAIVVYLVARLAAERRYRAA